MSRPLRIDIPGGIHHVTARGNARQNVFLDDSDRTRWIDLLVNTVERFGWLTLSYCQMTSHYHMLVETPQPNLSRGMRHLNGVYAQRFNRRHKRVGHLFQARFHATLIQHDEHLLSTIAYIARNPTRAGLCSDPAGWPWSSYRATLGLQPVGFVAADRVLGFLSHDRADAREKLRILCADPSSDHLHETLHEEVVLGDTTFKRDHAHHAEPIPEVPRRHWQPTRPPLLDLLQPPRPESIASAYKEYGYTMREIAEHLHVHYATVSRRLRTHEHDVAMQDLTP